MTSVAAWLRAPVRALTHPADLVDVVRASAVLRAVLRDMRDAPTGELLRFQPPPNALPLSDTRGEWSRREVRRADPATRWVRALRRANTFGPWSGTCLARALALHKLLARDGVTGSRVCIGVKGAAPAVEAHAWVEVDGVVVGDRPDVAREWMLLADGIPVSATV